LAERGFAGAAKADERDALDARREFRGRGLLLLTEEFRQRCVERRRNAIEKDDRDVALSGFELSEVAFGDVGEFGEIFSRERARFAKRADPLGQVAQE
jgi:hypothetical protein